MKYSPEIRFEDIDSYGIVHNAKYLIFFEQSRINLFHKIAGDWDWLNSGVLVARQKIDYRHPVKLNDKLEINVWVKEVGTKSLTISYEAHIHTGSKQILSAASETVIVCFDPTSNETILVPEVWKNSIKEHNLHLKDS
tara:strand:- start:176 stop:589 length:414 start_codon:yes stop_codon:yes gene_type:complete